MPLNSTVWGPAVATAIRNAITAQGIQAGTPITDSQIDEIWKAITLAHDTHISANASVSIPNAQGGAATLSGTVT